MDNPKKLKKKLAIFNKIFKELQLKIKTVMKKSSDPSYVAENLEDLNKFASQMSEFVVLYNTRDIELLKKVDLLSKFFNGKPSLSSSNKEFVWKYLETLFSLVKEQKQELVKQPTPLDMNNLGSMVSGLMADKSNGFGALIEDISEKLKGKIGTTDNLDQSAILADLMAGKMESGGINFGEIISQATSSLKEKVDSGEIDVNKIKDMADNLKSTLNL